MSILRWLRGRLVTADAVYGLILYSALIAVVSTDHGDSLEVFVVSALSLLVFWAAHVYAGTIAGHGMRDGSEVRVRDALRTTIGHVSGMLYAAILPSIVLLLGATPALSYDASVNASLYVVLVMLAVIGYSSFAERRSRVIIRILGALGTAAFGLVMIVLNAVVH